MNNESITIPTKDTPKPHNDKKVLLEAMKYRYATKKFDPEKIISDEDFETLLEAARLSPTSFGMEPWKILVIQNRKIREEMMPYGWGARAGLSGASHFVVFLANKREDITFGSPLCRPHAEGHPPGAAGSIQLLQPGVHPLRERGNENP